MPQKATLGAVKRKKFQNIVKIVYSGLIRNRFKILRISSKLTEKTSFRVF